MSLGTSLILAGTIFNTKSPTSKDLLQTDFSLLSSWHSQLATSLLISSSTSILFASFVVVLPAYEYLPLDYPSLVSLYVHHMWIGGFIIVGSSAHYSIALLTDISSSDKGSSLYLLLLSQRDIILGHLTWVTIFLGFHSFGLYIHNDSLLALGRPEDTFGDFSIQLKPIFSTLLSSSIPSSLLTLSFHCLGSKILSSSSTLGTADFMVTHIHAFTIHTTVLILLKSILYSRSSRLVSDKVSLGFRYPCDGPGRGGTCQISPWDHVFLALFWMYNSISTTIFHFYWKYQSDIWGSLSTSSLLVEINHLTSGDFSTNSTSVNGWLRTFLWSQSSQVIQSYSTSLSAYGYIFLGAHLIWAFSLMFLYSGRGYWQELIESIVWAHQKLSLVPCIQPRALSISQGRAVGLSHYLLGGIGCTWSFFLSRIMALSN